MSLDQAFQFVMSALWAVLIFVGVLQLAGLMTWVERKLSAMIQDRIGPNRANIRLGKYNLTLIGLIHIMCDPVKLFTKEDFVPEGANKALHTLAPVIGLVIPFIVFCVIPFAGPMKIKYRDIPSAELCPLVHYLERDVNMAADVPMGTRWSMPAKDMWLIGPLFNPDKNAYAGDLPYIGHKFQRKTVYSRDLSPMYRLFPGDALHLSDYTLKFVVADLEVGMLFVFAIGTLAVYSVILAGWASNNKYSFLGAMRGASQMISYEVALGITAVGVFMIYGGVSLAEVVQRQGDLLWGVVPKWGIVTQPLAFLLLFTCGMAEIKRVPFDLPEGESEIIAGYFTEYSSTKFTMFMFAEFVEMIVLSATITTLFLGGWQIPWIDAQGYHLLGWAGAWADTGIGETLGANGVGLLIMVLQAGKFTITLLVVLYLIFMMRWTYPRFRYDQIMRMGWKMVLPLALANVVVTGVVLAFTRGFV